MYNYIQCRTAYITQYWYYSCMYVYVVVVVVDAQLCLSGTIMFGVACHQHMCVCQKQLWEPHLCQVYGSLSGCQDNSAGLLLHTSHNQLFAGLPANMTTCETADWSNDILLWFRPNCESQADFLVAEFSCCFYWWCLFVCKCSMSYHNISYLTFLRLT